MKKYVYLLALLLYSTLSQTVLAETETFTGISKIVSRSPHVQEETRILAILESQRKAIEQAATYVESLPKIKDAVKQQWLFPFTIILFDIQNFPPTAIHENEQTGFEAKSKSSVDSDLLPENIPEYLRKYYQMLEINRHWLDYQNQMENALRQYITKIENLTDPVQIYKLQETEGKPLLNQFAAAEWLEKGGNSLERERWDESLQHFNQAIQLNPRYADAYFARGAAYFYKKM